MTKQQPAHLNPHETYHQPIVSFALFGVLGVTFFARIINLDYVFYKGFVSLTPDPCYHLRIIELILTGNMHLPLKDYYTNYPAGAIIYWPFGFDYLMSLLSLPVYLISRNMATVTRFLCFVIPALGVLQVYLVYRIISTLVQNKWFAVFGALIFSLSYSQLFLSQLGNIDHHVFESIFWIILVFFLVTRIESYDLPHSVGLGIILAVAQFFWNGAVLFLFFTGLVFVIQCALCQNPRIIIRKWRVTFGMATILIVPIVLINGSVWIKPFSSIYLSWFHVVIPGLGFISSWFIELLFVKKNVKAAAGMLVLFLGLIGSLFFFSDFSKTALTFLSGKDINAIMAKESQSIFQFYDYYLFTRQPDVFSLVFTFPYIIFMVLWKKSQRPLWATLFAIYILTGGLGLSQFRFLHYFTFINIIIFSVGAYDLFCRIQHRQSLSGGLVAILVLFSVLPVFPVKDMLRSYKKQVPYFATIQPVTHWIVTHTPAPSRFLKLSEYPSYSVFCAHWAFGHHISYFAKRPNIASPFGADENYNQGIRTAIRTSLLTDETQVIKTLDLLHSRYVITNDLTGLFARFLNVLSIVDDTGNENRSYDPQTSFLNQLHNMKGNPSFIYTDSQHFRLLYESPFLADQKPRWRLFERVPGAVVKGKTEPDRQLTIRMELVSNTGIRFNFVRIIHAEKTGEFSFVCPYSTEKNGDTESVSKLEVQDPKANQILYQIDIPEKSVLQGQTIDIRGDKFF